MWKLNRFNNTLRGKCIYYTVYTYAGGAEKCQCWIALRRTFEYMILYVHFPSWHHITKAASENGKNQLNTTKLKCYQLPYIQCNLMFSIQFMFTYRTERCWQWEEWKIRRRFLLHICRIWSEMRLVWEETLHASTHRQYLLSLILFWQHCRHYDDIPLTIITNTSSPSPSRQKVSNDKHWKMHTSLPQW